MNKKLFCGAVSISAVLLSALAARAQSPAYFQAVTNLNPTAYWPMHAAQAAVPGDIETNYGTLGALGNGYYADWNLNGGSPGNQFIEHQVPGALTNDPDGATMFNFNGTTNSYLLVPHTSPETTLRPPFTVECWVWSSDGSFGDIISQDGTALNGGNANNKEGFRISWNRGNNIQTYGTAGGLTSGSTPLNQWHYVAATYDGTNLILYTDGTSVSTTHTGYVVDSWDPLTIGNGLWNGGGPTRAATHLAIDDVAVYDTNLDSGTIYNHYESGIDPADFGAYKTNVLAAHPVLYYRMDAPAYSAPAANTWPILTNFGTVAVNGVFLPGSAPGGVDGPGNGEGLFAAGMGANSAPCNGMNPFADASYDPALDPTNHTPLSVALWFKGNPADSRFQTIVGHSDHSWRVDLDQHGKVHFNAGAGGEVTSAGNYNDGHWHQAVGVFDGGTDYLYVDGALDTVNTNATNAIIGSTDDVLLGGDPQYVNSNDGVGRQFAGNLCEVAFWNGTALTSNQIQTLYNVAGMPPTITAQPVSATKNQNTVFTNRIAATGSAPLTYQWYQNNSARSGATNDTLILNPVEGSDDGSYYVVVTNIAGAVTSDVATLTVNTSPTFTLQPVYTHLLLFVGGHATFKVAANGATPLHYQWFSNEGQISGATNATYMLTNVQPAGPSSFYCVVTNVAGSETSVVVSVTTTNDPTAPYPAAVLADHPMGYWRLNEQGPDGQTGPNNGVIANDYWGGFDGLYTNTELGLSGYNSTTDPDETSALFGYYATSDCLADNIQNVDFAAPASNSVNFSVEAWVNGGGGQSQDAGIVSKGYGSGGEQFDLDTGSHVKDQYGNTEYDFRFFVRDASGAVHAANSSISTGNAWQHVVGVCDQSDGVVKLYVNGALAGTGSIPPGSGINASARAMLIGARPGSSTSGNNFQFDGNINDVAVYDYALSADQVAAHYAAAGVPPNLFEPPAASVTVNENGPLVLSSSALATPPSGYVWSDPNSATLATGQTNGNILDTGLSLSHVPASWNGGYLQLTVTNAFGSVVSNVLVTVVSGAPHITRDLPPRVIGVEGNLYTYSVSLEGTEPFGYQWYSNNVALSGQTGASYTFESAPGNYQVVITNVDGAVTSVVSTLTTVPQLTNAYAKTILALNPAGYWPLQETNPPAPATMETNYGTLGPLGDAYYAGTNAAAAVTGGNVAFDQTPGALTASGDNDPAVGFQGGNNNSYLFAPIKTPALVLKAPLTFECWFNPASGSGFGDIMSDGGASDNGSGNWGGFRISYQTKGQLQAYCYYGSGSSYHSTGTGTGLLTTGSWHQCVMTYDGTNLLLYVDGTLEKSATFTDLVPSYDVPLTIGTGRWDGGPTRTPSGQVDEVAVYTNALSATQIMNHYLSGTTAGSNYVQAVENDKPLLYYRMDGAYTNPNPASYPVAVNYGSAPANGLYQSGIVPGQVPGPTIASLGPNSVAAPINGVFSCVDAGYDPSFDPAGEQPFTAMTWFRGNPWDNRTQAIMGQGVNWAMNIDGSNGRIVWNLYNGGQVTSTNILNDGNWHFIAGVYDGANSYLYVDGALNNSGPATGGLTGDTNDLYLGGDANYTFEQDQWGSRYFAGALAQTAFFTNALSAAQIQQIYNAAAPSVPTITLERSGGQVIITYTGTLLSSTNVAGPYSPVAGATPPTYTVMPSEAQMFYRASQ